MDIIIHGSTGRMGRQVRTLAEEGFAGARIAAMVSPDSPAGAEENCYTALDHYKGKAHCVVDFSHHTAAGPLLAYCRKRKLPVVIATTGQNGEELALIREAAKDIPVFFSANLSLGVALLADLAQRAAALFPDADIEIVECHHNGKLDIPSGTALMLGRKLQEVRPEAGLVVGRREQGRRDSREIGIHSLRLGGEVGTHEILIATGSETITLKHRAEDRALFAKGALTAAAFLQDKPAGLYTMEDIIKKEK